MEGAKNSKRISALDSAAGITPQGIKLDDDSSKKGGGAVPHAAFDQFKAVIGYNEANPGTCFHCHKPGGSASPFFSSVSAFSDQNAWIQSKWIVGGDPLASPIFYRLAGSAGSNGPKTMPLGAQLHSVQIKIVSDWITSLGNPVPIDVDVIGMPMRRLSREELRNTFNDLLNFGAPYNGGFTCNLNVIADQIPVDDLSGYENEDRSISYEHISKHLDLAVKFAECVKSRFTTKFAGGPRNLTCDANTSSVCRSEFIKNFGRQVFKRPLTITEAQFFESEYQAAIGSNKFIDLIAIMLSQPQLYYHFEIEGEADASDPNLFYLTPYELAARLSYHFWDTAPDAELRALADNGAILSNDVFRKQVDRLYSNTRTNKTFRGFYERWLKLNHVANLPYPYNIGEDYRIFAGTKMLENNSYSKIRTPAIEEIHKLTEHYSFNTTGKFSDLFTSPYSFTTSEDLSKVYETPVWSGSSQTSELEKVKFPNGNRSGILTRAALLFATSWKEQPILRGVEIRTRILCDDLPPPPPDAEATLEPEGVMTVREKTRIRTSEPKCIGCHNQINPLGFALSDFDSMGRYRTEEMHIAETRSSAGATYTPTMLTVNANAIPAIVLSDTTTQVTGGVQLSKLISESPKAHACFAKNYWKYTFGRPLDLATEQDVLDHLAKKLKEESLQNFFKEIVYQNAFKVRKRKL